MVRHQKVFSMSNYIVTYDVKAEQWSLRYARREDNERPYQVYPNGTFVCVMVQVSCYEAAFVEGANLLRKFCKTHFFKEIS